MARRYGASALFGVITALKLNERGFQIRLHTKRELSLPLCLDHLVDHLI